MDTLKEIAQEAGNVIKAHYVPLKDLADAFLEGNSKKHDIGKIIDSMQRYGFRDPMTFDPALNNQKGGLVEGNGRTEALQEMHKKGLNPPRGIKEAGGDWLVPVLFGVNASSESEAIAYSIEHNWAVAWGSSISVEETLSMFDQSALNKQVEFLSQEESLPLSFADDLEEILAKLELQEEEQKEDFELIEEDIPSVEEVEPLVQKGQVWELGLHRLYCGDSTDAAAIEKFMGGEIIDLLITDPPYGVSYSEKTKSTNKYRKEKGISGFGNEGEIANDSIKASEIREALWLPVFKSVFDVAKPGAAYYVFCAAGGELLAPMLQSLNESGWGTKHCLVWVKNQMVLGRSDYHYQHEPCLYGWKPGAAHYFTDSRTETSVLNFDKPLKNDLHPTMKPLELIAYLIGNSSRPSELVFDAFLGSGTTLMAAEQTKRICYGVELLERYCDVIIKRWENATSEKAVLIGEIGGDKTRD